MCADGLNLRGKEKISRNIGILSDLSNSKYYQMQFMIKITFNDVHDDALLIN